MALEPVGRLPLGSTGLVVSPICIGTSPLASVPALYGYEVEETRAEATIRAAMKSPFNFLDTSNNYGGGSAERLIGNVIRAEGGLPIGFVLATKVDADPTSGDFSADRVRRSAEESLERLGLHRIQLMYLHDPEYHITFQQAMAKNGPVDALIELRDTGVVEHLGVAAGPVQLSRDFIATGVFEVVLSHNRFTLLDRSAEPLMNDANQRGVAYINAAPYGGGILAKGPERQPKYAYRSTDGAILDAVRRMQLACERHGVPLSAAALQFSTNEPRITSTVVGVSRPARLAEIEELASRVIPDELWIELDSLAPNSELWLN